MQNEVRNILQKKGGEVHTAERETSVFDAVSRMNERSIGALVVVSGPQVVGIISERDILTRVVAAEKDARTTPVSEVMTRGVYTITPASTIQDAMAIMTEKRCRHLPVLEDGVLAGMISIGDVTRWNLRNQETRINDLVNYITSG